MDNDGILFIEIYKLKIVICSYRNSKRYAEMFE